MRMLKKEYLFAKPSLTYLKRCTQIHLNHLVRDKTGIFFFLLKCLKCTLMIGGFYLFQNPPGAQFIPKVIHSWMSRIPWSVMWLDYFLHLSESRGPRTMWMWQMNQLSADITPTKTGHWMYFLNWASFQRKETFTAVLWSTKPFNNLKPEYGVGLYCIYHSHLIPFKKKTWWISQIFVSVCADVEITEPSIGPSVFCGVGLALGLLGLATGVFFIAKGNWYNNTDNCRCYFVLVLMYSCICAKVTI